jgi:mono/diheme cytochrome c family protein
MADEEITTARSQEGESLWKRMFTRTLSNDSRGLLGTLAFFATIVLVGWVGINEGRRMETFTLQYEGRSIERGAVIFESNCSSCHGRDGKGLEGIAPALNAPDLFNGSRLASVGWAGSLEDYVYLTVAAGRPVMTASYPQNMPTWSQDYGGPMRPDEVQDVVNYILNYGKFYEEGYEAPSGPAVLPTAEAPSYVPIGADLTSELPAGDAARGERLFLGTETAPDGTILACNSCHSLDGSTVVGPTMQGAASAARLPAGYDSHEAYFRESILNPETYKAPGFEAINMVANFGDRLDAQSLADLIAYLMTLSE